MRKTKEILRLHFEQTLGQRRIARSASVSPSTVHDYLARFETAGLQWPLPEELDEERLEQALFPPSADRRREPRRTQPHVANVWRELEQHRDLTIELVWQEYRNEHPDGYSISVG